jgi:20S proteasome alpha/beta subunit
MPLSRKVNYNKPMTIAAVWSCSDGVLIGADTLIVDGQTKTYENKIFECSPWGSFPIVLMTGAGQFPRIKEFADRLSTDRVFENMWSLDDVKRSIRVAISERWYQASVKQTNKIGYNMELLFAVKDADGRTDILHLFNTELSPVQKYWCIGSGAPIAKYLTSWLYAASLPVEMCAMLALQIFREAKEHGDGCGGDTNLLTLLNGFDGSGPPPASIPETTFMPDLYAILRPVIYGCINKKVPDQIFDSHLDRLVDHMRAVRCKLNREL